MLRRDSRGSGKPHQKKPTSVTHGSREGGDGSQGGVYDDTVELRERDEKADGEGGRHPRAADTGVVPGCHSYLDVKDWAKKIRKYFQSV